MIRINKFIFAAFIFLAINLFPQTNVLTSYNIFNLKSVSETKISPDGNFIAYTVNVPRPFTDKPGSDYKYLYVFDISKNESKPLIEDKNDISSINWMNNSESITFIAKLNDEKKSQVNKINIDGGSPTPLTTASESVRQYQLSPDNSKLAFVSTEGKTEGKKKLLEEGFDAEIFEEENIDLNLYVKDLTGEETKQITSHASVFEFKWNPNGTEIAAAMANENLVDDSYMFKDIYLVDPRSSGRVKLIDPPGKLGNFEWSPDGKYIAFIAGVDVNDPVDGSFFISEISKRQKFEDLKNYSKDFIGSVESIGWKDNNTVLFSAQEGVETILSSQQIGRGEREIIIKPGEAVFHKFDYANDKIVFNGSSPKHPSELYIMDLQNSKLSKLTKVNPWLEKIQLAKQGKINYTSRDGLEIEAMLIYPLNFEEGKKFPLIIYVHGGPESAESNGWQTSYSKWGQIAAAKDFFVLIPNYRSSAGRGVEFSKMDFGDAGDEEFNDVIDGIDFLINKGFVNKNKVGIGGGSYGGYFAAWGATKHTERFAASVVFVGVSNQLSKRNTTDIPYESYYSHWGFWVHDNYEFVYDRSPVKYAHQSKTPTLILHGKEDTRVHPSQSLELYRILKLHSKAPVRLVFYPGQGHGNSKNTSKLDYNLRTMEWFEYYLKSDNPKTKMPDKYLEVELD